MRRILKGCKNHAKALELKLELETSNNYHVVLTSTHRQYHASCIGGICEGGITEDYLLHEKETYINSLYPTLADATLAYEVLKERYIN
jgi:hypothetical protein